MWKDSQKAGNKYKTREFVCQWKDLVLVTQFYFVKVQGLKIKIIFVVKFEVSNEK